MFSWAMLHVVVARYEMFAGCRTVIQCTLKFFNPNAERFRRLVLFYDDFCTVFDLALGRGRHRTA